MLRITNHDSRATSNIAVPGIHSPGVPHLSNVVDLLLRASNSHVDQVFDVADEWICDIALPRLRGCISRLGDRLLPLHEGAAMFVPLLLAPLTDVNRQRFDHGNL